MRLYNLLPAGRHVLKPKKTAIGTVSLSYLAWPFREGIDSPRGRGHSNVFESVCIAEIWRDQGFRVEICQHDDRGYAPPADCMVAIDIHDNLVRWQPRLSDGCIKICHATGCHWLPQNMSELVRLEALRARRGVSLKPRRQLSPSQACEVADVISILGNSYTQGTYYHCAKPIVRVPISSAYEFAWPYERDFESSKSRFLWAGSYGMVHKGLDLVIEAFSTMPDLTLTICGRAEKEEDFFSHYHRELTMTPNIRFLGWVDFASDRFCEIARTHASIIYPSSSEGGGGTVIHAMHAGLLPICTHEASVDLGDFGVLIETGTVRAVSDAARRVAEMSSQEVSHRARAAWDYVRRMHTREVFRKNYADFVQQTIHSFAE